MRRTPLVTRDGDPDNYYANTDGTYIADALDTGCWIDGHHGIYAIEMLGYLADSFGLLTEDDARIVHHHLHGSDGVSVTLSDGQTITRDDAHDIAPDIADELTNKLPASPSRVWEWWDGELYLTITRRLVTVSVVASVIVDASDVGTAHIAGEDEMNEYAVEHIADVLREYAGAQPYDHNTTTVPTSHPHATITITTRSTERNG